jgi:hypothetical protein
MVDTASVKNYQKVFKNQHIRHSHCDSTAFSRLNSDPLQRCKLRLLIPMSGVGIRSARCLILAPFGSNHEACDRQVGLQ